MIEVSQVGDVVAELGECPVWSVDEQVLYWEDIIGKAIHRYDPATHETQTRQLPGRPGSFVLTDVVGTLLVAMETDLVWLDWASGDTTPFVRLEDPALGNRLNDGRCDHRGRYIVGTMHPVPADGHEQGFLYSVSHEGVSQTLENDVIVPNGLVFDPERGRMYWIDSPSLVIWVWDYDLDTGTRSNKRVFFDYSGHDEAHGTGDGACLDAKGFYWSASVYGWALTRITPEGVIDRIIPLPVQKPSMPAFGGPDLATLYITTIGTDGPTPATPGLDGFEPGMLLSIQPGVQGVLEPKFATR
jgi:L-arabinonolactonase